MTSCPTADGEKAPVSRTEGGRRDYWTWRIAPKRLEADAFAAAIHAGHEQNRRRRGNRDVLREELAVARFDAGLQFGFAHEREAAVRVQIDDSPAGFDLIRCDESGRNGQITEIGGPGPADAFEAAALMQRVLEFFEPGAEACGMPDSGSTHNPSSAVR